MTHQPGADDAAGYLTEEGRRLLEDRVRELEERVRALREAVEERDRSNEVVESYHRAATELERVREFLESAAPVEAVPDNPRIVEVGDRVAIRLADGAEEEYVIVHALEAAVDDLRISVESPLAQALLGRDVGAEIVVEVPTGSYRCTILRADRRGDR